MNNELSSNQNENNDRNDAIIGRFLQTMPSDVSATFTDTQLAELKKVLIKQANNLSPVNIRLSIPFFKRRFYLVFLMGKEKRSLERLRRTKFKIINQFTVLLYLSLVIGVILVGSYFLIAEQLSPNSPQNQQNKELEDIQKYLERNP